MFLAPLLLPLASVSAFAGEPCGQAQVASGMDPVDATQNKVVTWINTQDAAALFGAFSPAMQAAVPLAATQGLVAGVHAAGGCITTSERLAGTASGATYRWTAATHVWQLDLHVAADGVVQGMSITEPPAPAPPVARSTIPLRLPVDGAWTVFWGGDTPELNHHVGFASQRRAADLLIFDAAGKSHSGDGSRLTDYYAFGKPVSAVAPGVVVTAIDGVPESVPGRLNPYVVIGNAVIIDHGGMWSVVAHLQPGSLKVKVGQTVKSGQVLGLTGNTGNSSEPHLHFQLMDGPAFEASYGVEAVFSGVSLIRDGKEQAAGEYTFRKGDVVSRKQGG